MIIPWVTLVIGMVTLNVLAAPAVGKEMFKDQEPQTAATAALVMLIAIEMVLGSGFWIFVMALGATSSQ